MEYNPSLTPAYLAGKVDEYVKFAARDTIKRSAARDPNCRYARIPDGGACDFCRMLGSRGFVYHSEESAGGVAHGAKQDTYHPFCNCQIAVCFDPFIEKYQAGWTTVTRGYGDGQVTVPGRDGSDALREVDIDELYAEYKAMAKDFNASGKSSRYKDYAKGARLSDEQFDAAMKRLSEARTRDELHAVAKEIEDSWPPNANGRDRAQLDEMRRHAKELEKRLLTDGDKLTRVVPNETGQRVAASKELLDEVLDDIMNNGFDIEIGTDVALQLIRMAEGDAVTLDSFRLVCFQEHPTISELLEEQFHVAQAARHDYDEVADIILRSYYREIDAQCYLMDAEALYNIPENEAKQTREALKYWTQKARRREREISESPRV